MLGFIYIMSNESFSENLLKIGYSERDPSKYRVKELDTTGVPTPFNVEYYALVEEPDVVEKEIHISLAKYRKSTNREFFTCSTSTAVEMIREVSKNRLKYEISNYENDTAISQESLEELVDNKIRTKYKNIKSSSKGYDGETIRGGIRYGEKWTGKCERCGDPYSVTITRYDTVTKCPKCLLSKRL